MNKKSNNKWSKLVREKLFKTTFYVNKTDEIRKKNIEQEINKQIKLIIKIVNIYNNN